MKEKKYDSNKFFVGELHMGIVLESSLLANVKIPLTTNERKKLNIINETINKGAINYEKKDNINHFDYKKYCNYKYLYTCFLETNNGYICLHNGCEYTIDSFDTCHNLVPINSIFPNPNSLYSISEVLNIFNILYCRGNIFKLYDNKTYSINDFYMGVVNVFTKEYNKEERTFKYYNLAQNLLLDKQTVLKDSGVVDGTFFNRYYSVFLKQDNGLLNLCNNTVYKDGVLDYEYYENYSDKKDYYECISPLNWYLNNYYGSKDITIKKVLKTCNKKD